jgi:hypothetical protein
MRDTREIAALRMRLWDVNVEYSAVLRCKGRQPGASGLDELKAQRLALMAEIAELRRRNRIEPFVAGAGLGGARAAAWRRPWADVLSGIGMAAAAVPAALQRYWAGGDMRERKAV